MRERPQTALRLQPRQRQGVASGLRKAVLALVFLVPLAVAGPASADDEHDPERTGHPLRIVAYVLHPVGVVVDTLLFRPAHWLVNHEPFRTLFGHED